MYRYIELLQAQGGAKAVPITFMENPTGLISRNQGADLAELVQSFNRLGYGVMPVVIDAKHYVPQSRPRLFLASVDRSALVRLDTRSFPETPSEAYTAPLLKWIAAHPGLELFTLPLPAFPERDIQLEDVVDVMDPNPENWASKAFEQELIQNLVGRQRQRFDQMVASKRVTMATISRRGRTHPDGHTFNATEIASRNSLAPCQRPYKGGSSRTWVLIAGEGTYRIKVISPRESARLMGLPDSFWLPAHPKAAYAATGDAIVPQAVRWFDDNVLAHLSAALHDEAKQSLVPHLGAMEQLALL